MLQSIQAKLIAAIVLVALAAAVPLFVYDQWVLRNALTADANEILLAAAKRTASRLDGFSNDTRQDLAAQAQLPVLSAYLRERRDLHRAGTTQSKPYTMQGESIWRAEALNALTAYQLKRPVFLLSYALLDTDGRNVLDTIEDDIGTDESGFYHYRTVMTIAFGRRPVQSPVYFSRGTPHIYFSARINDTDGNPLGVLRARCSLSMISYLALLDEGFAGPSSYPIVVDGNNLIVAHANRQHQGMAGKFATLPDDTKLGELLPQYGLNINEVQALDLGWDSFVGAMYDAVATQRNYFQYTTHWKPTTGMHAVITATDNTNWRVIFVKSNDSFLAPVYDNTRRAIWALAVSSLLAAALGWLLGWWLTRPIVHLTDSATALAAGELNVRAPIRSRDETGSLAKAFNYMAERLVARIRFETAVADISSRFLSMEMTANIEDAITDTLTTIGEIIDVERTYILWSEDLQTPTTLLQWYRDGGEPLTFSSSQPYGGIQWMLKRTAEQHYVAIEDTAALRTQGREELTSWTDSGASATLCVAVRSQGQMRGLIGCDMLGAHRRWQDVEQRMLQMVGELIWAAQERYNNHQARIDAENALQSINEELEARVWRRTRELSETNAHLEAEIRTKEALQRERARMLTQIVESARQAGMAEIAANVLHNVGNVATSAVVSVGSLRDAISSSSMKQLDKVAHLIKKQGDDFANFVANDPRGSRLPQYLLMLFEAIANERSQIITDMESLEQTMDHIVAIIRNQQSKVNDSQFITQEDCGTIVEDALRFHRARIAELGIILHCDLAQTTTLSVDKHKVLQILDNLIDNACSAIANSRAANPNGGDVTTQPDALWVSLFRDDRCLRIQVRDSGPGISQEIQARMFTRGYTTKADGSGLGLHISAVAAQEMGGKLTVHSEGLGTGATFTLELPLTQVSSSLERQTV